MNILYSIDIAATHQIKSITCTLLNVKFPTLYNFNAYKTDLLNTYLFLIVEVQSNDSIISESFEKFICKWEKKKILKRKQENFFIIFW